MQHPPLIIDEKLILLLIFYDSMDDWEKDMAAKYSGVFDADKQF